MSDDETEIIFSQSQYLQQLKQAKDQGIHANEKLHEIEQIKEKYESQNKEFILQINQLNENLQLKSKYIENQENELQKLKSCIDKREGSLIQIMKEKSELEAQLQQSNSARDDTFQQISYVQKHIQELEQNILKYTSQNDKLKEQNAALKAKGNGLDQNTKMKQLNDQVQSQLQKIAKLEENNNLIRIQLEQKDMQLAQSEQRQKIIQSQTSDLINELIEQKNNVLNASVHGITMNTTTELKKQNEELEKLKQEKRNLLINLDSLKQELQFGKEKIQDEESQKLAALKQVKQLNEAIKQKDNDIQLFVQQHEENKKKLQKEDKYQKLSEDASKQLAQQENQIKDLKSRNITLEQNIASQQKTISELLEFKAEVKNNPDSDKDQKISILQSELKNLSSFIYESPIEIIFNLLEDRLTKQNEKSPKQQDKKIQYWTNQLEPWQLGLKELKNNFQNLNIQFNFTLKA